MLWWGGCWTGVGGGLPGTGLLGLGLAGACLVGVARAEERPVPRVAVLTTEWRQNSHADMIAGRILAGYALDGTGDFPRLKIASVYTDQVPAIDTSRRLAARHGVQVCDSIRQALTLGGPKLAVDGVLLIAEHGNYPESPSGQFQFPKRRFWEQLLAVFEESGRVVPVFHDKHLADNWTDAAWILEQIERHKIPVLAGSCVPLGWRDPALDTPRGEKLEEVLAVSYHRLDSYGFHGLEVLQALAERRAGGESGIAEVRCLEGDAVWQAGREGLYDPQLLTAVLARLKGQPLPPDKPLAQLVPRPVLMHLRYADGLKGNVLTLNHAVAEFAAGWRTGRGEREATLFRLQEDRPLMHFRQLVEAIERFITTGARGWPLERTILTSGALDELLQSRLAGGSPRATPQLLRKYTPSAIDWKQPPPAPPGRPLDEPFR
ncbi:MAG: hypothetical protein ACKOFW_14980 [Planctomycetaceae bacterium]